MRHSHFAQIFFSLFAVAFVLAAAGVALPFSINEGDINRVQAAGGSDPNDLRMLGYVWSPTVGWISFCGGRDNESNCPGGEDYQVWVNNDTGHFSGWGWSPNVGWISFDRSVTGAPPFGDDCGSSAIGCIDPTNLTGQGWGRFIAACDFDGTSCTSSGAGSDAGSWDGWVRLGETGIGDANFSVGASSTSSDGSRLLGYAWGSEITGFTSFDLTSNLSAVTPEGNLDLQILEFSPNIQSGRVPFRVLLTAVVTSTSALEFKYTFDCGNSVDEIYSFSTTATTTCIYTIPQDYTVSLTVEQDGVLVEASDAVVFPTAIRAFPPGIIEIPPEELPEDF